ncbi:MAG: dienelactone hydrolase family protein [Gammaproteobacteria bacterium]|jgi:dienelactone hydrolase
MMIKEQLIDYEHDGTLLEGFIAYDDAIEDASPAVLISHAWGGQGEFDANKARSMAALGYVGFALDLYGKGVRGNSPEENSKLMQPLLDDRKLLQSRMLASLETIRSVPGVDSSRIAAMGFCFGGLCVLDLARTGEDIQGVISLHGLFIPPVNTQGKTIKAKVLVIHGHEDPMVPPEAVSALEEELAQAGADWQIHVYGNTRHAFTNPDANDHDRGTVYSKDADRRSWQASLSFLDEVLGK